LVLFQKKLYLKLKEKMQFKFKNCRIGIYAKSGASTVELSKEIKKK
jgi:hypothetical protein